MNIKQIIRKIIPQKYLNRIIGIEINLLNGYANKSYSYDGEDRILKTLFSNLEQETGFYVDVGAYHPKNLSNTHILYKKGWCGINIEPNAEMIKKLKKERKRDTNLNIGISKVPGYYYYYMFSEPGLNTFKEELMKVNLDKFIKKITIETKTLENVLNKYLKSNVIDLMNIDVEGLDLQVLQSNNWEKFRPKYILVEAHKTDISQLHNCPINKYLTENGYKIFARTMITSFYRDICII